MEAADYIKKTLPEAIVESHVAYNQDVIVIRAADLVRIAKILRDELGFEILLDVVALDWQKWPEKKSTRFEVDYFFLSTKNSARVHLKVPVENDVNPKVDSLSEIYPSANWAERECFDMMGIHFNGHPNLKRLLMWTEFIGHPLRKDYPLNRRQPLPVIDEIV